SQNETISMRNCPYCSRLLQRRVVDHEAVLHVLLEQPVIRLVNLLDADLFDVRGNAALAAEIEHLLGLAYAPYARAREATARHQQIKSSYGQRLFRSSDKAECAVSPEQAEIGIEVMVGGDSIQNKVEAAGVLLHLVGVFGDDHFIRPQPFGVSCFMG